MDWRLLDLINFLGTGSQKVYSDLSEKELAFSKANYEHHSFSKDQVYKSTDIFLSPNKEAILEMQHSFSTIVYVPKSIAARISPPKIKGFDTKRFTIAYSINDARYLLPYENKLSEIFKMTPKGVLMSQIRKVILLGIEKLNLKFILPTAFIFTKSSYQSNVQQICESISPKIKSTCLFTGTQGLTRRLTLQLTDDKDRSYYAKVSTNTFSAKKIEKEVDVLTKINKLSFKQTQVPQKLSEGRFGDTRWFVQSSFDASGYEHPDEISSNHIAFLNELKSNSSTDCELKEHPVYKNILQNVDLINYADSEALIDKLKEYELCKFQLIHSHGDFTSWNLKIKSEKIFVYDWEAFTENQLPLFDLFHYIVQDGILIKKQTVADIYKSILETLEQYSDHTFCKNAIDKIDLLLLLYILDIRIEYAKLISVEDPGFVQVQWQEKIRLEFIEFLDQKISS